MSSLFLRKYRSSETVELSIQNLNELTVKELKDNVSSKLEIPVDQLKLVYCGRVLKVGRAAVDYKVTAGCTLHVLLTQPKGNKSKPATRGGLLNNRRVLTLLGRVLGSPAVLQDMAHSLGMTLGNEAMLQLMGNQQLMASLSDPDNIQEYIEDNPAMAAMMEHILRQFLGSAYEGAGQDEDQLVDLLETHLEEEVAQAERDVETERTHAQEQMFEHSRAIQAHQAGHASTPAGPSHNGPSAGVQDTSFNPTTSQQTGSVFPQSGSSGGSSGITHDQLAFALANALGSSPQPISSNQHAPPLHSAPPPPYSAVAPAVQSSSSTISPTVTRSQSSHSTGSSHQQDTGAGEGQGVISAADLQQALANMVPPTGSLVGGGSRSRSSGGADAGRYEMQLEQLRMMGIDDETACLHALAATNGDVQAALEILYSK